MVQMIQNLGNNLQSIMLVALRLNLGLLFAMAGWGKFGNLENTTKFFASIGIPMANIQAPMVAGFELIGGLLLE